MHKYGREFSAAVMENRDGCVSDRVSLGGVSRFRLILWLVPGALKLRFLS
jgi:hypothetical protein